MNTLAHLAGFVAILYLCVYSFTTLSNPYLGGVFTLLIIWALWSTALAAGDDWDDFNSDDDEDKDKVKGMRQRSYLMVGACLFSMSFYLYATTHGI